MALGCLGSASLSVGSHTLEIARREDGYNIDRIVVSTGGAPSGNGPAESSCTGSTALRPAPASWKARQEAGQSIEWRLYPNPGSGVLNVEAVSLEEEAGGMIRVRVLDVAGRSYYTHGGNLDSRLRLELNTLPAGVYYIEIVAAGHRQIYRWVKL